MSLLKTFSFAIGFAGYTLCISLGSALAEVSSNPCPYDCDTQNIPRSQCKDWRENGRCFIEDLRPGAGALDEASVKREITNVNRTVVSGTSEQVELHDRKILRIDVVVRREGSSPATQLKLALEGGLPLGSSQQVDSNSNQVLAFSAGDINPRGKELILHAIGGNLYIESVHVLYRK